MTRRIYYLLALLLFLGASRAWAQYTLEDERLMRTQTLSDSTEKPHWSDRFFFGGGIGGLQFGRVTNISLLPMVGYKITPDWHAGVGIKYNYYRDKRYTPTITDNIYGGRLFTRYLFSIGNQLQITPHLEYEFLQRDSSWEWLSGTFQSLMPGIGLYQPIGPRSGINILALYNVLYSAGNSPYASPWVLRVDFNL